MSTETWIGIAIIVAVQAVVLVRLFVVGKQKADQSQVSHIQKAQDLQFEELKQARIELKEMRSELKGREYAGDKVLTAKLAEMTSSEISTFALKTVALALKKTNESFLA